MRDETEELGRRVYRRKFEVKMPVDAEGYAGRTCPQCGLFFKVKAGTGRSEDHPQHCPDCGCLAEQIHFLTRAQMDYARAIASRMGDMADAGAVESLIAGVLDSRVRRGMPRGDGDAMLRRKVRPAPMPKFREPDIAEKYLCPNCLLRYAVATPPRMCPDCGEPASSLPPHPVRPADPSRPADAADPVRPANAAHPVDASDPTHSPDPTHSSDADSAKKSAGKKHARKR